MATVWDQIRKRAMQRRSLGKGKEGSAGPQVKYAMPKGTIRRARVDTQETKVMAKDVLGPLSASNRISGPLKSSDIYGNGNNVTGDIHEGIRRSQLQKSMIRKSMESAQDYTRTIANEEF